MYVRIYVYSISNANKPRDAGTAHITGPGESAIFASRNKLITLYASCPYPAHSQPNGAPHSTRTHRGFPHASYRPKRPVKKQKKTGAGGLLAVYSPTDLGSKTPKGQNSISSLSLLHCPPDCSCLLAPKPPFHAGGRMILHCFRPPPDNWFYFSHIRAIRQSDFFALLLYIPRRPSKDRTSIVLYCCR